MWPFGIFVGYLVHIFPPVLVRITEKNLATLDKNTKSVTELILVLLQKTVYYLENFALYILNSCIF
jgi:hypothetical protein